MNLVSIKAYNTRHTKVQRSLSDSLGRSVLMLTHESINLH